MYPFAEQILAYKADDKDKRIGGLTLEVKGDFCRKVKEILTRHGRAEDYIEISLDSEYCYNPLHSDLDAYALAYNIASLLNNLFGRGKEPFWQQAYTNLVKFIILLHKITYDYVTLFDVYHCAISPDKLEKTIHEAEQKIGGRRYVLISSEAYLTHVSELAPFKFNLGVGDLGRYRADDSERLRVFLHNKGIEFETLTESSPDDPDSFVLPDLISEFTEIDLDASISDDEKEKQKTERQQHCEADTANPDQVPQPIHQRRHERASVTEPDRGSSQRITFIFIQQFRKFLDMSSLAVARFLSSEIRTNGPEVGVRTWSTRQHRPPAALPLASRSA